MYYIYAGWDANLWKCSKTTNRTAVIVKRLIVYRLKKNIFTLLHTY